MTSDLDIYRSANVWRRIRAALLDLSGIKFKDDPTN